MPSFELVVSKKGHKMTEAADSVAPKVADPPKSPVDAEGYPVFAGPGAIVMKGHARWQEDRLTMAAFVNRLANYVGQPVIDATGLPGKYAFSLFWTTDTATEGAAGEAGPGIFEALQQQLGLQLRPQKGPVDVLVIDTMEKTPAGN